MQSAAYIAGVLDTLVKAGEVSPAYAAGVADVLGKQAMWWNSVGGAQREFLEKNPNAKNPDGTWNITPDQAVEVANRGVTHWWNGDGVGWGDWAGNRWDMARTYLPGFLGGTSADRRGMLSHQYKVMQNKALLERLRSGGLQDLDPALAGAVQDAFVRDANDMYSYAKDHMSPEEMTAADIGENYADRFRTAAGTAAIRDGKYKPTYDVGAGQPAAANAGQKGPKRPAYGEGLPTSYGANKHLFYNTGYTSAVTDPTRK